MEYEIVWQPLALVSFEEELDFILLKWNLKEAEKFSKLVEKSIERIKLEPEIGKFDSKNRTYFLVISK